MWLQHDQLKMKKLEKKVEFLKLNFYILFTRVNYK